MGLSGRGHVPKYVRQKSDYMYIADKKENNPRKVFRFGSKDNGYYLHDGKKSKFKEVSSRVILVAPVVSPPYGGMTVAL